MIPAWVRTFIGVLAIAIAVFLFFKFFFDQNPNSLVTEILAATLGALLTVLITTMLLEKQSQLQFSNDSLQAAENVKFEARLELYRQFIAYYTNAATDGVLCKDELMRLEELALTISLLSDDDSVEAVHGDLPKLGELVCQFVLQLQLYGLKAEYTDEDHENWQAFLHEREIDIAGDDTFTGDLLLPCDVLSSMRWSLGQHDEVTIGRDSYAQLLLNYRDYRADDMSGREPGVVG